MAHDDIIINQDWGFDIPTIQTRFDIWQGDADQNIPLHAAEYLHDRLRNSQLTILPGEGHLFFLNRWQQVLARLAA